jgi:hypothetical protein
MDQESVRAYDGWASNFVMLKALRTHLKQFGISLFQLICIFNMCLRSDVTPLFIALDRIIRKWTKQRNIHSNAFGYLGHFSWAIITAGEDIYRERERERTYFFVELMTDNA